MINHNAKGRIIVHRETPKSENELYHQHKYISKKWSNGKWYYIYDIRDKAKSAIKTGRKFVKNFVDKVTGKQQKRSDMARKIQVRKQFDRAKAKGLQSSTAYDNKKAYQEKVNSMFSRAESKGRHSSAAYDIQKSNEAKARKEKTSAMFERAKSKGRHSSAEYNIKRNNYKQNVNNMFDSAKAKGQTASDNYDNDIGRKLSNAIKKLRSRNEEKNRQEAQEREKRRMSEEREALKKKAESSKRKTAQRKKAAEAASKIRDGYY